MHPYLIHSGHLLLPTFGVLAALGLMAALTLSLRTAPLTHLDPDKLWNAGLFTLLAAFALSRLLLIATNLSNFLHYPILLLMVPSLTPAGIALTALATLLYLFHHLPVLDTLDAWSAPASLAWAALGLGHLAEGSDAGLPTNLPWGLAIPPSHLRLHPAALYTALAAAILTAVLLRRLQNRRRAGDTAAHGLASAGAIQFLVTFTRQPYPYLEQGPYTVLDPIQWIALGMIVLAGMLLLLPRKLVSHAV